MKMWSGRFRQPLDPEFEKWQRSFPYDQRLLPFELAASRAHANALAHARAELSWDGLVPRFEAIYAQGIERHRTRRSAPMSRKPSGRSWT